MVGGAPGPQAAAELAPLNDAQRPAGGVRQTLDRGPDRPLVVHLSRADVVVREAVLEGSRKDRASRRRARKAPAHVEPQQPDGVVAAANARPLKDELVEDGGLAPAV